MEEGFWGAKEPRLDRDFLGVNYYMCHTVIDVRKETRMKTVLSFSELGAATVLPEGV